MIETSQILSSSSGSQKGIAETGINQAKNFRAAIYLHTDRANQKFGYSTQIEACRKYIEQNGWIACDLFLEKNKTGTTTDTPIFQLMIKRAKSGCFDAIVVYSQDRLSRSRLDLDKLRKTLNECNVAIGSATENIEGFSKLQASAHEISD